MELIIWWFKNYDDFELTLEYIKENYDYRWFDGKEIEPHADSEECERNFGWDVTELKIKKWGLITCCDADDWEDILDFRDFIRYKVWDEIYVSDNGRDFAPSEFSKYNNTKLIETCSTSIWKYAQKRFIYIWSNKILIEPNLEIWKIK